MIVIYVYIKVGEREKETIGSVYHLVCSQQLVPWSPGASGPQTQATQGSSLPDLVLSALQAAQQLATVCRKRHSFLNVSFVCVDQRLAW
jgi:hypothetical protein